MPYRYFHNEKDRTVYRVPTEPRVFHQKGKRGEPGLWKVSMEVEMTCARNYRDPKTGRHTLPLRDIPREEYLEMRDTREDAIRWFLMSNLPDGEEFNAEEYWNLERQYQQEADAGPTK